MTEEKQRFIQDLAKENNSLVRSMLKPCTFTGIQPSLDRITSFEKLIRIIQGLPCDRQWISIEVTLLYNYSLVLRLATPTTASIPLGSLGRIAPGSRALRFGVNPEKTLDGVIQAFLSRVESLTGDKVFKASAGDEQMSLSSELIKRLLLISFPGSAKTMLLRLSVTYCLRLLDCRLLKEASEVSLQMVEQVLPQLADLFQIDAINSHFNLPQLCLEPVSRPDASLLADSVRVVAAVSSFRLLDWNQCLAYMRQTVSFPLKLYCSYVEGYVLYQQKAIKTALCSLSELAKRVDLTRELSRDIRNLIGCCLSSQGKHRSAIQVFRKCLEEDFLFPLPLYNIAIQYQRLSLFDAEIEMLQLLEKLLNSNRSSTSANESDFLQFDDAKESSRSRYQLVSRQQVLQLLARRCLELGRYSDAADAYHELLSHLSTVGSFSDSGSADVAHSLSSSINLLYSRTIYANICAKRFDEALTLCDDILSKIDPSLESLSNDLTSQGQARPSRSSYEAGHATAIQPKALSKVNLNPEASRLTGKRLHEEEGGCGPERSAGDAVISLDAGISPDAGQSPDVTNGLFEAAVLLYKAEALVSVDQRNDSLLCINQAITILELNWVDTTSRGNLDQPHSKKIKLDRAAGEGEQPCIWRQMLSDAYSIKGLVLVTLDRTQDALHWSRLAYQLNNSDTEKVYNLSLLLYKLQRNNEAASLWLSHRDLVTLPHDSLQLDVILKRCSANLGKLTTTETSSSKGRHYSLDVEALNTLRTVKRKT